MTQSTSPAIQVPAIMPTQSIGVPLVDWQDVATSSLATADEIAEAAGVSIRSIARARLDPSSSAYRSPAEDWQSVLTRLARQRIHELTKFAEALESGDE